MNMNIPIPKVGARQMCFKPQNGDFLKNGSNDFNSVSELCGDYIPE
jgi:hypothetical protein